MSDAIDPRDRMPPPYLERRLVPGLALAVLGATATVVAVGACGPAAALPVLGVLILVATFNRVGQRATGYVIGGWVLGLALLLVMAPGKSAEVTFRRRTLCMTRLKNIGNAVAFYRMDNAEAYPPDLRALIATNHLRPRELECPGDTGPGGLDYFYVHPGTPPHAPPSDTAILACDFRRNHRGRRNVLFHGLHVEGLTERKFRARLAQPENAAFAAALRAAEGP